MQSTRFPFAPALALMLLFPSWTALAAPPDEAAQIQNHLEFQGYTVVLSAERMAAKHPAKLNFSLKKYQGGILMTAFLRGKTGDRLAALEMANKLNTDSAVTRIYLDKDGDWTFEAWISGYEKTGFGAFLALWERDTLGLLGKYKTEMKSLIQ